MTVRGLFAHVRDRHAARLLLVGGLAMVGFVATCIAVTRAGATSTARTGLGEKPLVVAMLGSVLLYAGTLFVGSLAEDGRSADDARAGGWSPRRSRARRRGRPRARLGRAEARRRAALGSPR